MSPALKVWSINHWTDWRVTFHLLQGRVLGPSDFSDSRRAQGDLFLNGKICLCVYLSAQVYRERAVTM